MKTTDRSPFLDDEFYVMHAGLLCRSYQQFTGRPLLAGRIDSTDLVTALFKAPFALVSHGTGNDPVFNFGNQTALALFELSWPEFIALPSRLSAEPVNQEERQRLLERVAEHGYIDDYSGIRVSSTGRKFMINNAVVWNVVDGSGRYHGQAAAFDNWSYL
jgi:hypothetical protein